VQGSKRELRKGVWELRLTLGKDPSRRSTGGSPKPSTARHGTAREADKALRQLVDEPAPAEDGVGATFGQLKPEGQRNWRLSELCGIVKEYGDTTKSDPSHKNPTNCQNRVLALSKVRAIGEHIVPVQLPNLVDSVDGRNTQKIESRLLITRRSRGQVLPPPLLPPPLLKRWSAASRPAKVPTMGFIGAIYLDLLSLCVRPSVPPLTPPSRALASGSETPT
jgi:hypothetical protein